MTATRILRRLGYCSDSDTAATWTRRRLGYWATDPKPPTLRSLRAARGARVHLFSPSLYMTPHRGPSARRAVAVAGPGRARLGSTVGGRTTFSTALPFGRPAGAPMRSNRSRVVKPAASGQTGRAWSNRPRVVKPVARGQTGRYWSNRPRVVKPAASGQTGGQTGQTGTHASRTARTQPASSA